MKKKNIIAAFGAVSLLAGFVISADVKADWADGPEKNFDCTMQMDYTLPAENGGLLVRSVDVLVQGARSATGTLVGSVYVEAGNTYTYLNSPYTSLSAQTVGIKGKNNKDGVALTLNYMENAEGEPNENNRASLAVRTVDGVVNASTQIANPVEGGPTFYPVNCVIER